MARFHLGLDLGQANDATAWAVIERLWQQERRLHLCHLERARLGTSYPAIVRRTQEMMQREELQGQVELVVDATGVGAPVVDLLKEAGLRPLPVIVTSGAEANWDGNMWRIPKRELISGLQVLLQNGRLKIAHALPETETLVGELCNYRVRISGSQDSYEGAHDDLLSATALAAWFAKGAPPSGVIIVPGQSRKQPKEKEREKDPFVIRPPERRRGWH